MTDRERIISVLDGHLPDRIPWIPRLQLWYEARIRTESMPDDWEDYSLRDVEIALSTGNPARSGKIFKIAYENVDVVKKSENGKTVTEYHTPKGSVRTVSHYSNTLDEVGLPGRVEEYPLKGPADYRVWEYVVEHTVWEPRYEEYSAYEQEVGEAGLPMVAVGDVPIHNFAQTLAGYNHAYYQLADHSAEVSHLLSVMVGVEKERLWPVIARSPARLLQHGSHLSSQFTPPPVFEKHILPYYGEFHAQMHDAGKSVAMHADADTSLILTQIEDAGWDMVECFVTAPMVPLTMKKAREVWSDRVIIWGGLPSLLFAPSIPEAEFRQYVDELFTTIAPGSGFILGVADNIMPDSVIGRVRWVSEYVERNGNCPLSP